MVHGSCSAAVFTSRGRGHWLLLASTCVALACLHLLASTCGSATTSTTSSTTTTSTATTTTTRPLYKCHTKAWLKNATQMPRKGMCVDDTTFWHCPSKMPGMWPNVKGKHLGSLRLFKPWHPHWGDDKARQKAWNYMKTWLETNNAQVLLGTEVTCNSAADDQMWQWSLDMIKFFGKDRIMGVAIGNEMDVFYRGKPQSCIHELWNTRYWETIQARVADVDKLGMTDTPITSVWAMSVMEDMPFKEDGQAKVNSLVTKAFKKWGKRWVWSFNVYGIWDGSLYPTGVGDCNAKVSTATHITYIKSILQAARKRMKMITGNDDDTMWMGENGWSSPMPHGHPKFRSCPDYDSLSTFRTAYESFLTWDMTLDDGLKGPDWAFYFTMRDSFNGFSGESFGLIRTCTDTTCKISRQGSTAGVKSPGTNLTQFGMMK